MVVSIFDYFIDIGQGSQVIIGYHIGKKKNPHRASLQITFVWMHFILFMHFAGKRQT